MEKIETPVNKNNISQYFTIKIMNINEQFYL